MKEKCLYCDEPGRLYPFGWRCADHGPPPPPTPNPEWTAAAFKARRGKPDNLPEECLHGEPRGPRYCPLCRRQAQP